MTGPQDLALIFDFGNVLAFFDHGRACERIAQSRNLNGADLLERARSSAFPALAKRYELGEIDDANLLGGFRDAVGLDISETEFASAWGDIFSPNPPVANLVHRLADHGFPLVLGSNTGAIHARQIRRQFVSLLDRFDQLVLSFEIGAMKPSKRFFDACVAAALRPAANCIFIDDVPEYVAGARAAGLHAVHYRQPDQLAADLTALGLVLPKDLSPIR